MLLRKLEDIENRLLTLVDAFLEEPELEEHECDGMFGGDGQRPTAGMNVLDMVVAMVFGRLPRDFIKSTGSEEHFQMLFDHHIHIRRLWKKDFGRLPPRSHVAGMDDVDDEENAQAAAQDASSDDGHNPYDDEEEHALDYGDDPYEELDEHTEAMTLGEALSSSLRVTDDQQRHSSSSSKLDDWEAINVDESAAAAEATALAGDGMDGYGADFDSGESDEEPDSEDDFVAVPSTSAAASTTASTEEKPASRRSELAAPSTDALVRRHRHRALPGEAKTKKKTKTKKKSKAASSRRTSDRAASTEQEQQQTQRKEKERQEERAFFQPFACTRAVGLLQIAKDNEMF